MRLFLVVAVAVLASLTACGLEKGCGADFECASGLTCTGCLTDDGSKQCSKKCATDADCGSGHHCAVAACGSELWCFEKAL